MQIENGICKLCDKQERVFYDSGITNDIKTEFLSSVEVYLTDLEQLRICPTCAYKVQLSCTMKKNHGKPLRRQAKPAQLCAFCGIQDGILLKTDDTPSDFISKVNKFVKLSNGADYEKSLVCLRCLFGINIWTETQSRVFATLGISGQDEVENNNSVESAKEIMIVSPEVEETRGNSRSLRSKSLAIPPSTRNIQNIASGKTSRIKNLNSKLRNRLKQTISVKDLQTINFAESVKGDQKMYFSVPYVSIQQIKLRNLEGISHKKGTSLKSLPSVSSQNYGLNRHLCQICDKSFATKCEYLSHHLRHEKVEELVIKVQRLNVDKDGNVQKLKKKPCLLPAETVNKLLTKYLGDTVVIDDSCLEIEENRKDKKSDEHDEQQLKQKRKHFQFKINLNKKKKNLNVGEDECNEESSPCVLEENQNTSETINEDTSQNETENDIPKNIESTPSKRRKSSDSDDITPTVSPLRVTENSDAEDSGIKIMRTSDEDVQEDVKDSLPKENEEITNDIPMDVDTSTEVEEKEETDLNSSSQLLHTEESSSQPQSTEDVETPSSEKDEEDVSSVPVIVEDEATQTAEIVTEENLDKGISEEVSSSQDTEKSSEDTVKPCQSQEIEEVPQSQDIEEVPQSQDIEEVPQSPDIEEVPQSPDIEEVPQSQAVEDIPRSQESEENKEESQSQDTKEASQSEEIEEIEVSRSQEIEEESHSQENVEGSQSEEREGTKAETELIQSGTTSDVLDALNEATVETDSDVIIVEEVSVREQRERSPTLTKLRKRRMTTVLEIMDTVISDDDDDEKVVEVLEDSEKNENISDKKKKCTNTISLLDGEEITIEEDQTNEESDKNDKDEHLLEKPKENDEDKDLNNSSKESSSSDDAVLKQVEMLGETVVWSTQSDSNSNETEPDSSPTFNGDNTAVEKPETVSNNAPIMTNEDLLNILVDDDADDNDASGGKRKRSTDTETSTSKKARTEGEEGTSSK